MSRWSRVLATLDSHPSSPRGRGWQRAVLVLFAGACFSAVLAPLTSSDIWWHLAAGRWMVEAGQWPTHDTFSVSAEGRPWIDVHWLFQLFAFALYSLGGVSALMLGKGAVFALAASLLLLAADRAALQRRALAALVLIVWIVAGRHLVLMRPVLLSLLYLAALLWLLERGDRGRRWRWIALIAGVQLLWANTQPLSPLGPAVLLACGVGDGLTQLAHRGRVPGFASAPEGRSLGAVWMAVIVAAAVCFVTPYGWEGVRLPFQHLLRIDPLGPSPFTLGISENIPPWILERGRGGPVWAFKWVAAASFCSFALRPRRIELSRLLLVVGFFGLALMANRNLLLFYWVAAPAVAGNLAGFVDGLRSTAWQPPWVARVGAGVAAVTLLGVNGWGLAVTARGPAIGRPVPLSVPSVAADMLAALPTGARVFSSVRYGSYLAWRTAPQVRPWIDGRLVLRTPEFFQAHLDLVDDPSRIDALQARWRFDAALLPTAQPDRYLPLVRYLYFHSGWRLVYTDGTQTLFLPVSDNRWPTVDLSDRETVAEIERDSEERYRDSPRARSRAVMHLGHLLAEVGHLDRAEEVLVSEESRPAQALLARVYTRHGKLDAAWALSLRTLERWPDDVDTLILLARISLTRGDHASAAEYTRRALAIDPHDPEARSLREVPPTETPESHRGGA